MSGCFLKGVGVKVGMRECGERGKGEYLHPVGGRGLSKLLAAPHDLIVLGVGGLEAGALTLAGGVGGGAKVQQTGLAREMVQPLARGLWGRRLGRRRQRAEEQRDGRDEMHLDWQQQRQEGERVEWVDKHTI